MDLITLPLEQHFNNIGVTADPFRERGDFDGGGGSYPYEDLCHLVGVPYGLSEVCDGSGRLDNVCCEGQLVSLPRMIFAQRCTVTGSAEGSFEEPLRFEGDKAREVMFGMTDFLACEACFGEELRAIASHYHDPNGDVNGPRPRLWSATVKFEPVLPITTLYLPGNPLLHIFSITLTGLAAPGPA